MVRYQWGVVEMTILKTAANSGGLVGGDPLSMRYASFRRKESLKAIEVDECFI